MQSNIQYYTTLREGAREGIIPNISTLYRSVQQCMRGVYTQMWVKPGNKLKIWAMWRNYFLVVYIERNFPIIYLWRT